MNWMTAVMLLSWADAPQVELETLTGDKTVGQVVSVDATGWALKTSEKQVVVESREVLSVRLKAGAGTIPKRGPVEVIFTDGARLNAKSITSTGKEAAVESAVAGEMTIPRTALSSVRLVASPSAVDESWATLLKRETKQDMLVIRKGEVLDFVEGVIGTVTADNVNFLLDGDNLSVPRARVFGLIYYQSTDRRRLKANAKVTFISGDQLFLRQVTSNGQSLSLTTVTGGKFDVPISQVKEVNLSYGKLQWLAELKPRDLKHESLFIDVGEFYQPNQDVYGGRLRIGKKEYSRGISVRSRTQLRYRIDGDFTRFQSWLGIQRGYSGEVQVKISADGKPLHDSIVKPGVDPVRLDLDVSGKYSLEILVDYGSAKTDQGDHLVLGDAVLIK